MNRRTAALEPVCWAELPPQPWLNGRGITRTVATHPQGATHWRISVADIERDGPFSRFPGSRRSAVLVSGPGLCLRCGTAAHRSRDVGSTAHFDGEEELDAVLPGGPSRLWNVIYAREKFTVDVRVGRENGNLGPAHLNAILVLNVLSSSARGGSHLMEAQQGQVFALHGNEEPLTLSPAIALHSGRPPRFTSGEKHGS